MEEDPVQCFGPQLLFLAFLHRARAALTLDGSVGSRGSTIRHN
jgi:hypothetical protein